MSLEKETAPDGGGAVPGGARPRRTGDTVTIDGGYQHRAMLSGNAVQRFWHHTKKLVIAELLPPDSDDFVIDVGCGSGVITAYLGGHAGGAAGIDGNPLAINYAKEHFQSGKVSFMEALVDENMALPAAPGKIYCLELIEHIHVDQGLALLRNLRKVSAPGARMLLTTPNYRSLWPAIEWAMDRFTNAPQLDDHQHVAHYHPKSLAALADASGWEVETLRTVSFLAPWLAPISWKLANSVHSLEGRVGWMPGSIIAGVFRARGDD